MERLTDMLRRDVGPVAPLDALSRRTLAVFEAAMQCRARYGERAIGSYVVAGAEGPDDILAPLVLARWAGVDDRRSGTVGMDFAPLFESGDSLRAAGSIMREVLANPTIASTLPPAPSRNRCSSATPKPDATAVISPCAWPPSMPSAICTRTFSDAGQQVSIRHARGGSIARGGSRLDAVIRATPPETVDGALHITEQGEIISQNYGLKVNALALA